MVREPADVRVVPGRGRPARRPSERAVAAAAAGSGGVGVEDDAEAGDGLVEFWQVERDVVGDDAGRAT